MSPGYVRRASERNLGFRLGKASAVAGRASQPSGGSDCPTGHPVPLRQVPVFRKVAHSARRDGRAHVSITDTLMEQLRRRWLPILAAALVLGGSIAWFAWPSTAAGAGSML